MKVLGIESSCDETSASVVENGTTLLSNVIATSLDLHAQFGGVVPEIAARSHIEYMTPVIEQAMEQAGCGWPDIDAIAVTKGAGLGGSLLVGTLSARTLAILKDKPLYGVNHVQAHVAGAFIGDNPPTFPILALIVSGGHSQLVYFRSFYDYTLLGKTRDDAVGEAFDKVAKILGLPYPGGPSISKIAEDGDPNRYVFPKSKLDNPYDFSFSGLKTAVLRTAQTEIGETFAFPSYQIAEHLSETQKADLASSFQKTAIETLLDKLELATREYTPTSVVIAGGVASNQVLRTSAQERLAVPVIYPSPALCTDNGAMIAVAGYFAHRANIQPDDPYTLEISPQLSM